MDAEISRSQVTRANDPHDWNSYDHYYAIHEKRLTEHPFVYGSRPNTLSFDSVETGGVLHLTLSGIVYCRSNVILEVEKWFETRQIANRLQIRGVLYRYIAWIENGNPILRYHNLHTNIDEYSHRVFNHITNEEIFYEVLKREQFPLFTEILDEIESLISKI